MAGGAARPLRPFDTRCTRPWRAHKHVTIVTDNSPHFPQYNSTQRHPRPWSPGIKGVLSSALQSCTAPPEDHPPQGHFIVILTSLLLCWQSLPVPSAAFAVRRGHLSAGRSATTPFFIFLFFGRERERPSLPNKIKSNKNVGFTARAAFHYG